MRKKLVWYLAALTCTFVFNACDNKVACDSETFVERCADDHMGSVRCVNGEEREVSCNPNGGPEHRCVEYFSKVACNEVSEENNSIYKGFDCLVENEQPASYEWYRDAENANMWTTRKHEITEDAICIGVHDDKDGLVNRLIKPGEPREGMTIPVTGNLGCYKNHAFFKPNSWSFHGIEGIESEIMYIDCGENYRCDYTYGCLPPCSINDGKIGEEKTYDRWDTRGSIYVGCSETNGNYTDNKETLYYTKSKDVSESASRAVLYSDFDSIDNPDGQACDADYKSHCFGTAAINCVDGIIVVDASSGYQVCREETESGVTVARIYEPCSPVDEGKKVKYCSNNVYDETVSTEYECRKSTRKNGITEWYFYPLESKICENGCDATYECK